ncbi:hypothetical protein BaRGS_00023197, partial [Batillaria attramentaria]
GPSQVSVSGPSLPFDTDGRQKMTLHCTVPASTYNPSLTYAWRRLPSNTVVSTTSSFTFTVTPQDDGKQIQCTASNSQYSELQAHDTFTLDVNYPPTAAPTIANYNDILYAGDTLTLTCTVRGGKPVVRQVNFICDDKADGSDVVRQDDVSSSITLTGLVPANDGDDCTCSADWKTYGWYTLTAHRRLVVYYKPSSPDIQAANGTSYPFIAGETTNASLVCESSDHGNPAASYTWPQTGGGHTWTDSQGRGRLTFDLLTPSHSGKQVTCHASNNYTEHKQDPVVDGSFHLQVYYHPIISMDPRADSNNCYLTFDRRSCEVTEGQGLHINCTSHSNPSPVSTVWTKDGSNVASGSMLTIDVTNRTVHTDQTVRSHLTVNSQPHNVTVNESDTVYMECRADGRPTPTMRLVNTDSGQEKNYTDGGHVTLEDRDSWLTYTLYHADCQDAGTYRCTAGNDVSKPRRDSINALPSANYRGTPVHLPFDVVAHPVPDTFQLSYLGTIDSGVGSVTDVPHSHLTITCSPTQAVYIATCNITVKNMTESDAGFYNVRIGNAYGYGDIRAPNNGGNKRRRSEHWRYSGGDSGGDDCSFCCHGNRFLPVGMATALDTSMCWSDDVNRGQMVEMDSVEDAAETQPPSVYEDLKRRDMDLPSEYSQLSKRTSYANVGSGYEK